MKPWIIHSILCFAVLMVPRLYSQPLKYISPGITISINTNGYCIFSPKISLGILQNDTFYNITLGKAWSNDRSAYPHSFLELQCGTLLRNSDVLNREIFIGGGIGITLPSPSRIEHSSLRLTAFAGSLYFLNSTILFTDPLQADLGFQLVLPLPLQRIENE